MASPRDVVVRILGEDRTAAAVASASKSIGGLQKAVQGNETAFKALAATGAAAFVGIAAYATQAIGNAMEAESIQARLTKVIKQSVDATDEQIAALNRQAEAMERLGVVSADSIRTMQEEAASFDLSADAIERLTPAATDFAVALYGINPSAEQARQAMTGLGKALQGQLDLLSKKGYIMSEEQKHLLENGSETERVATLVEVLNSNYEDLNQTMRRTAQGGMVGLQFAMERVSESVGNALIPLLLELTDAFTPVLERVAGFIEANPQLTATIVIATAAVAGLTAAVGALALAVAAFETVAWPVVGVVAAFTAGVALLVFGLVQLWEALGLNNLSWQELMMTLDAGTGLITYLQTVWASLVEFLRVTMDGVLADLLQMWQQHRDILIFIAKVIGGTVVVAIALLVSSLAGLIAIGAGLIRAFTAVGAFFSDIFLPIINAIVETVEGFISLVEKAIRAAQRLIGLGGSVPRVDPDDARFMSVDDGAFQSSATDTIAPGGAAAPAFQPVTYNLDFSKSTFLSEDVAEQIGDLMVSRLGLSNPLQL